MMFEDRGRRFARRQHAQHIADTHPQAPDAGPATALVRPDRDARQELGHSGNVAEMRARRNRGQPKESLGWIGLRSGVGPRAC